MKMNRIIKNLSKFPTNQIKNKNILEIYSNLGEKNN